VRECGFDLPPAQRTAPLQESQETTLQIAQIPSSARGTAGVKRIKGIDLLPETRR
jgi:hypothetical protein